jgi:transposase
MAGKKGMQHYPLWFRQEVVDKHIKEGVSMTQLYDQYGVDTRQIRRWCAWYRQNGVPKQMTGKRQGRPRSSDGTESLEQKVKRLEMENVLLKKLNELLMEEETKQK